jgi:hypothetical protein
MQSLACLHDAGLHHLLVEFSIAVSISVLGITPASVSLLAFTITMKRIVVLRLDIGLDGRLRRAAGLVEWI